MNTTSIYFGRWSYKPELGVLKDRSCGVESSEIFLSQNVKLLLEYFLKNPQRLISQSEIATEVFGSNQGNNINVLRMVGALRKLLKDEVKSSVYIETVRKRGFIFIASVNFGTDLNFYSSFASENKSRHESLLIKIFCFSLFFLTSIFAYLFFYNSEKVIFHLWKSNDLSSMPGQEMYPSLSPDGRYILYSHSPDRVSNFSIIIQEIGSNNKFVLKNDTSAGLNGFAWLKDQSGFYYQKVKGNEICEIRKIILNKEYNSVESDSLITNCGLYSFYTRLYLSSDQEFLFFSSKPDKDIGAFITKFSLKSSSKYQISVPPAESFGDYSLSVSPDGRYLAFLRDKNYTHAQLWLLSLENGQSRLLFESDEIFPYMLSWTLDQKQILLPNGTTKLLAFDMSSESLQTLSYSDKPVFEFMQTGYDTYIGSTGHYWNSSLWKFDNPLTTSGSTAEKLIETISGDMLVIPNIRRDGPTAVISNRSGTKGLWLYFSDGRQVQVNDIVLTNSLTNGRFSNDGQKLLIQTGSNLWLVQHGAVSIKLPVEVDVSSIFSWSSDDKSIIYAYSHFGQVSLSKFNLAEQQSTSLDAQLKFYEESPDGSYVIQLRYGQPFFELIFKGRQEVISLTHIKNPSQVARGLILRKNALYFENNLSDKGNEVIRFNLQEKKLEHTGISQLLRGRRLDVSLDEKFIYLEDGVKGDTEISLFSP